MHNYTNHSGGAIGSDHQWQVIGEQYGFYNHNHYYWKKQTPYGNFEISKSDYDEGQVKATIAARQMGRISEHFQIRNDLIIRNWCQVKYSEQIYAIGRLIPRNGELDYGKVALIVQVSGGTGYAVQMAINENKPVYIFDQVRNSWYSNINNIWSACIVPVLTNNYAGIGTREIMDNGIKAIHDVYNKTLDNI